MKTEKTQKAKRQKMAKTDQESFYVTLPSTINRKSEFEKEQEEAFGYPDFYEDTDNMNRYLW